MDAVSIIRLFGLIGVGGLDRVTAGLYSSMALGIFFGLYQDSVYNDSFLCFVVCIETDISSMLLGIHITFMYLYAAHDS